MAKEQKLEYYGPNRNFTARCEICGLYYGIWWMHKETGYHKAVVRATKRLRRLVKAKEASS